MSFPLPAAVQLPERVVETLVTGGASFYASVPCNTFTGLLRALDQDPRVQHVPVTREEEGVGLCAGAALAGRLPVLVMLNSGLGNCLNALLSCTQLYGLPLVLLVSYRGGPDELIDAQRPMGRAMRPLLAALGIEYFEVDVASHLPRFDEILGLARRGRAAAAIIHPCFWQPAA